MPIRLILLLAFVALSATAQTVTLPVPASRMAETLDRPTLEAAQQANPDDPNATAALLRFYATGPNDPDWTKRLTLLTWNIQHHPEASFLGSQFPIGPSVYQNMPQFVHDQIKPLWIAQVHQHPDDPRVLRNAAAGIETLPVVIRVGGNVQANNLLRQVKPAYPAEARQAHIQGTVRFNATISPEGTIQTLQLVSGHPLLVAASTEAVQQWVYKPTLLNGNPVAVATTIDVNFTLNP